jgi:ABC-type uncharacterized transport system fused permease/ATPase subunit
MSFSNDSTGSHPRPLSRFWASAAGFWTGPCAWQAWLLSVFLIAVAAAQLLTQYWLNYWNRDFFNALERREAAELTRVALMFFPLAAANTLLAIASVWGRMTTQRKWRHFLSAHVIDAWLAQGRYRLLGHLNGTEQPRNAEFRIAEDVRVATDAPIDLVLALFSSIMTIAIFFGVLSSVGGSLSLAIAGTHFTIPAYLAIAVVLYSGLVTASMLAIGHRLSSVIQDQMQAEAGFRAAANLVRESGDGILVSKSDAEERHALWAGLSAVIEAWRRLCWQLMRTTLVTHGNLLLAPVVGLLLCVPKYLDGQMSLGEVTQAAAAFATVQSAFNWFVDNYQRMADWRSSAHRVAVLLLALDALHPEEQAVPAAAASEARRPGLEPAAS